MPLATSDPSAAAGSRRLLFWMLSTFLLLLWIAGGASRADAAGQPIVRLAAWALLVAYVFRGPWPDWRRLGFPAVLLSLTGILVAAQLIPLPPTLWIALPGRSLLAEAAEITGQSQPWRPISVSPGATANALGALVVPAIVLLLAANLGRAQRWQVLTVILVLILGGAILGALQFSGTLLDNPLINDVRGMVSANFANRNHLALFLAIGCLLAPAWAMRRDGRDRWRLLGLLLLLPLLVLMILATGSRAGLVLGAVGLIAGFGAVWPDARRNFANLPRHTIIAGAAALAAVVGIAIALSVGMDRAVSISRVVEMNAGADMRSKALPVVVTLIWNYLPVGSGFGTFDPVYRIIEPDTLLSPRYFNHAHNDWLEIALEGGVLSIALMASALLWWGRLSLNAWRYSTESCVLARIGSAVIFLISLASAVDYPARTPMVMAILMLGAVWLNDGAHPGPGRRQHST